MWKSVFTLKGKPAVFESTKNRFECQIWKIGLTKRSIIAFTIQDFIDMIIISVRGSVKESRPQPLSPLPSCVTQ